MSYSDVLLHINGTWRKSHSGQTIPVLNPATEEVIDSVPRGTEKDPHAAVDAARAAFVKEPPLGSPLLALDNVVLTPHLGGRTLDGQRRMGELVIENCLRALRGEAPLHRVE